MEKEILLGEKKIIYTLKKTRRARHMRLSVSADASVKVSVPPYVSQRQVENFVLEKAPWILEHLTRFEKKVSAMPKATREDYLKYKELAREIAEKKLKHFNLGYGFTWKKVAIRNTKTRWGSCSMAGNLNFSYRIIYLPEKLCDYIIVHELCHLGQFNHSQKFWDLVSREYPEYKKARREIKAL